MMPKEEIWRNLKHFSLLVFGFSLLFFVYFQTCEHNPAFADINSYSEDPYDAVGSFGIQLALLAALLSLLRSIRPYPKTGVPDNQLLLTLRGTVVALLAIIVTLFSNLIATLRYAALWTGYPAGWWLAGLTAMMVLFAVLFTSMSFRAAKNAGLGHPQRNWTKAIIVGLASILILAFYPSSLRQRVPGGILTAVLGMLLLFVGTWSLAKSFFPQANFRYEDVFDDLAAIYQKARIRLSIMSGFFTLLEKASRIPFVRAVTAWLNPRRHRWNMVILLAILLGILLAAAKAMREGVPPNPGRALVVTFVYIGIEGAGVIIGYLLLGDFLGIFRRTD